VEPPQLALVPRSHRRALTLGTLTISQIAAVSFVEGTCAVFFGLAEAGALPLVVPKEQLAAAVAQGQIQYSVGGIVGPPLGGARYSTAHLLPFAADAASYVFSGLSLAAVRARLQRERNAARRSLGDEIREGLAWLWAHPLIRFMAFLTSSINIGTTGFVLIIVVLAKEQGASSALTGVILGVIGAAGIVGAVSGAAIQRRFSFGQVAIDGAPGDANLAGNVHNRRTLGVQVADRRVLRVPQPQSARTFFLGSLLPQARRGMSAFSSIQRIVN